MNKPKNRTELGGVLGEKVTLEKVNNRVVVTNRPKRILKPVTEKQEAIRQRFLEAVQYSKEELAKEDGRQMYEAAVPEKGRTARMVAMTDYLSVPKVRDLNTSEYLGGIGDLIVVRATDDFMVTGVKIVIKDSDGNVLEKGEAEPTGKINYWQYAATVSNPSLKGTKIQVTAFDRPGNKGFREVTL